MQSVCTYVSAKIQLTPPPAVLATCRLPLHLCIVEKRKITTTSFAHYNPLPLIISRIFTTWRESNWITIITRTDWISLRTVINPVSWAFRSASLLDSNNTTTTSIIIIWPLMIFRWSFRTTPPRLKMRCTQTNAHLPHDTIVYAEYF